MLIKSNIYYNTISLNFELIWPGKDYSNIELVVDILTMFRLMINDMVECVFVIGNRFIIVNIYKLVFVLCTTKVLIILKRSNSNIYTEYTTYPALKPKPYVTTQCPFNVTSTSFQLPLTFPSLSPYPPLNKKSQDNIDNNFVLFAIDHMELIQIDMTGITNYKLIIIEQNLNLQL